MRSLLLGFNQSKMHFPLSFFYLPLAFNFIVVAGTSIDTGTSGNSSESEEYYHNLFIVSRMEHLKAVRDLKQLSDAVKQHQLVTDFVKKTFRVLNVNRNVLAMAAAGDFILSADVITYIENTAFFCDLLVFFPKITLKLVDANLLWRITLIDSIQFATSSNMKFVDENTLTQLEKASKILEDADIQEQDTGGVQKKVHNEAKKPQRRPKLSMNEL